MLFEIHNGAIQTTAAPTAVTTGTSIKTMLQFKASATLAAKIAAWAISFDGYLAATPIKVELIETDVAATVTAYVAADITKVDADAIACGDPTTNLIQVGTSASGYTSTNEGSITSVRNLEIPQFIAPTTQFVQRYSLDEMPVVQVAKFARIRVTAPAAVNCYCGLWIKL